MIRALIHVRMSSSVRLSVCLSSVTFVHPTRAIKIFGNILRRLVRLTSVDFKVKFYVKGVKPKRGSQISRFWTFARLYLGNGAR